MQEFRHTWTVADITAAKTQALGWIANNPVAQLSRIKVRQKPTDWFTDAQFTRLLDAVYLYDKRDKASAGLSPNAERLLTLLSLMRYSGLAIGDAATLERGCLSEDDTLFLYRQKTGVPVFVPLPHDVAESLRSVPPGPKPNSRYFFWSGNGERKSTVADWQRAFYRLVELADIKNSDDTPKRCHLHRLRDTFAVDLLLNGAKLSVWILSSEATHGQFLMTIPGLRVLPPCWRTPAFLSASTGHQMRALSLLPVCKGGQPAYNGALSSYAIRISTNTRANFGAFFMKSRLLFMIGIASLALPAATTTFAQTADPLPSWNTGPAKQAIVEFVRATTDATSPQFVPPAERIATFDQDGTLWVEQPFATQGIFCLDRVPALAAAKPALKDVEPFKTALSGDLSAIMKLSIPELEKLVMATHSGMTVDQFQADVKTWLATARDPKWHLPYTQLTYQPMQEVLHYLRDNGYMTYIVTGGGQDFVRVFSEQTYGIPPEQVVGSMGGVTYGYDANGKPILTKEPTLILNDDHTGKVEGIHMSIGRRPHAAFGNTPGDQQMLEYTKAGDGARLAMLVLHDDATREYAYGPAQGLPGVGLGAFPQAYYDLAIKNGWTVISMKNDWNRVFAFDGANTEQKTEEKGTTMTPTQDRPVTAIDTLLEPDAVMIEHATADNARLLQNFPKGYTLGGVHAPHVSMLQRYVYTDELDKVYAAVDKVFAEEDPTSWKLKAFKYYYIPAGPIGLGGIVVEPTPDLLRLQQKLIAAEAPFVAPTGTAAAYVTTPQDPDIVAPLIEYVRVFVPEHSGAHFSPHVTIGVGTIDFLNALLAEPFAPFTFSPVGASVYHLGNYGTAMVKLHAIPVKH